ncbi:DUF5694 domain-containing protein [Parerythrobacter jejuensis]|uniref:TraB/GumN family protein n=1 Tax=Parerythrobacter jejuensis TaxID=795812 RepID=A0A845ATE1_9SPHN|nr:DUF5694 domain-containing protein [Parerythrobacter jejuensis]MXP32101.1 hypothetical protein [Parerythrobacter jejuensis]
MVIRFLATLLAFTLPTSLMAQGTDTPDPVEVMILGSYHFANPGRDAVNMEVDDVLSPRRQKEIATLSNTLAQWAPTRVVVEARASGPDFELADYADTDTLLSTSRNESVQIGYRLARAMGHRAVFGFDEQPEGDEPDYFPLQSVQQFARANGQEAILTSLFADLQEQISAEQARLPDQTIAGSLIFHNRPDLVEAQHHKLYYSLLSIGDGDAQPGAELNAYWYMRNAKMFAKLNKVAQPGDRVLVIVGSGHSAWLRHFAERMPGYRLVEVMPYLIGANAASRVDGE